MIRMIEWLDEQPRESNELPWVKEYIDSGEDASEPIVVEYIYKCASGFLVMTEFWKGYIFGKSKLATQLTEALPKYLEADELLPRLVTCANASGKINLGLDKEQVDCAWKNVGKEYHQRYVAAEEILAERNKPSSNPLIANPSPRKAKAPQSTSMATTNGKR